MQISDVINLAHCALEGDRVAQKALNDIFEEHNLERLQISKLYILTQYRFNAEDKKELVWGNIEENLPNGVEEATQESLMDFYDLNLCHSDMFIMNFGDFLQQMELAEIEFIKWRSPEDIGFEEFDMTLELIEILTPYCKLPPEEWY